MKANLSQHPWTMGFLIGAVMAEALTFHEEHDPAQPHVELAEAPTFIDDAPILVSPSTIATRDDYDWSGNSDVWKSDPR